MQCSSLAHYVAPGFNLGWSNAGRWQPEVERLKSFTNIAGAMLPQLAMAEFLESGAFDKHLKRLRVALWQSVEAARQEVLRVFPEGTRVARPRAALCCGFSCPTVSTADRSSATPPPRASTPARSRCSLRAATYASFIRISCGQPFELLKPAIRAIGARLSRRAATAWK